MSSTVALVREFQRRRRFRALRQPPNRHQTHVLINGDPGLARNTLTGVEAGR